MPKRPLSWICAASLVICLHGCSLLFVKSAPSDYATRPYFSCTSSRVAPIFDTIGAATYGFSAVTQVALGTSSDPDLPVGITVLTFAFAATLGASAAVGYASTSECSDALHARDTRVGMPMSPLQPTTAPALPAAHVPAVPNTPAAPIPPHEAPVLLFGEPTPPATTAPPPAPNTSAPTPQPTP